MTDIYRLSSSRFPANSGLGAALFGGRWNPLGTEVIYASATRSLAALEVLVHFAVLPHDFVMTEIVIPKDLAVLSMEETDFPNGWDDPKVSAATQKIGSRWVTEERFAVLSVPSSIVREERNFVLNPMHWDFSRIWFSTPVPFRFDPRLK